MHTLPIEHFWNHILPTVPWRHCLWFSYPKWWYDFTADLVDCSPESLLASFSTSGAGMQNPLCMQTVDLCGVLFRLQYRVVWYNLGQGSKRPAYRIHLITCISSEMLSPHVCREAFRSEEYLSWFWRRSTLKVVRINFVIMLLSRFKILLVLSCLLKVPLWDRTRAPLETLFPYMCGIRCFTSLLSIASRKHKYPAEWTSTSERLSLDLRPESPIVVGLTSPQPLNVWKGILQKKEFSIVCL